MPLSDMAAIKKKNASLGAPTITSKEFNRMKSTESGITGTLISLRNSLKDLDGEIKADKRGERGSRLGDGGGGGVQERARAPSLSMEE